MPHHRGPYSDEMLLALALWLCSLPLVAIFVLPWLGLKAAAGLAAALFVVALLACWGACDRNLMGRREREP
jgi:hypothetical protein